jgi:hypothetical protein
LSIVVSVKSNNWRQNQESMFGSHYLILILGRCRRIIRSKLMNWLLSLVKSIDYLHLLFKETLIENDATTNGMFNKTVRHISSLDRLILHVEKRNRIELELFFLIIDCWHSSKEQRWLIYKRKSQQVRLDIWFKKPDDNNSSRIITCVYSDYTYNELSMIISRMRQSFCFLKRHEANKWQFIKFFFFFLL